MIEAPPHAPWSGPAGPAAPRTTKTVMVVVPELFVLELLATHLRAAGCFPLAVQTVNEGKRLAAQVVPDAIVVDIDGLSPDDGAWVAQMARVTVPRSVRTAVLSSRLATDCGPDRESCGATLCVGKPFEPREFMVQLLRLLRQPVDERNGAPTRAALRRGPVEVSLEQPTVSIRNAEGWRTVDLAWTEHRLLEFLLSDPGRVRSREAIRLAVWPDVSVHLRTVDQYVRRLRRSLDQVDAGGLVKTVTGDGYRLQLDALTPSVN